MVRSQNGQTWSLARFRQHLHIATTKSSMQVGGLCGVALGALFLSVGLLCHLVSFHVGAAPSSTDGGGKGRGGAGTLTAAMDCVGGCRRVAASGLSLGQLRGGALDIHPRDSRETAERQPRDSRDISSRDTARDTAEVQPRYSRDTSFAGARLQLGREAARHLGRKRGGRPR